MTKYFSFIKFMSNYPSDTFTDIETDLNKDSHFGYITTDEFIYVLTPTNFPDPFNSNHIMFKVDPEQLIMETTIISSQLYDNLKDANYGYGERRQNRIKEVLLDDSIQYTPSIKIPELQYIDMSKKIGMNYLQFISILLKNKPITLTEIETILNSGLIELDDPWLVFKQQPIYNLKLAKNRKNAFLSTNTNLIYNSCLKTITDADEYSKVDKINIEEIPNLSYLKYRLDELTPEQLNTLHVKLYNLLNVEGYTITIKELVSDALLKKLEYNHPLEDVLCSDLKALYITIHQHQKKLLTKKSINVTYYEYNNHPLRADKNVKFNITFNNKSPNW